MVPWCFWSAPSPVPLNFLITSVTNLIQGFYISGIRIGPKRPQESVKYREYLYLITLKFIPCLANTVRRAGTSWPIKTNLSTSKDQNPTRKSL